MTINAAPTQSQIEAVLRTFLLTILPAGIEVVLGQVNRVPEPVGPDYVVYWAAGSTRLSTNIDSYNDATYTGSIAGSTLNIASVNSGAPTLSAGTPIYGAGIADGTQITALGTGTGGVGTYTVNNAQTVASTLIAAGGRIFKQPLHVEFQLDVHGPNSGVNAVIISTLGRDSYAVDLFLVSGFDITPLYFDDPKQVPFLNAESQFEERWIVQAHLQVNQVVSGVPQQFASSVNVGLVNVDATIH